MFNFFKFGRTKKSYVTSDGDLEKNIETVQNAVSEVSNEIQKAFGKQFDEMKKGKVKLIDVKTGEAISKEQFMKRGFDDNMKMVSTEASKLEWWSDVIDFVIKGGNPNAIDENGNTFLHRFPEWTDELVKYGVSLSNAGVKNNDGYIPLSLTARNPHLKLIEATPKEYLNIVWPNGTTIMTKYLKESHLTENAIKVFESLLKAGADLRTPNKKGQTPLDIIGQRIDYFDYFVCAFENGHDISDVKMDYKENWYSQETKKIPLLFAMMKNAYSDKCIEGLLNILSKSDLTQRDDNGNTLLHTWATEFDKNEGRGEEAREQLFSVLATKISVNALNSNGETPLVSAFKIGEYYAEYMCHGSPHSYETTRKDFAALLLDKMDAYGVNLADKDGMTALHYAAKEGFNNEVVALVQKGANVSAKNAEGKTPADVADNNLMKAYLNLIAERVPQKITTQSVSLNRTDHQNTIE